MEICEPIIYEGTKDELIAIIQALEGPSINKKHTITLNLNTKSEIDSFRKKVANLFIQKQENNTKRFMDFLEDQNELGDDLPSDIELNFSITKSFFDIPELKKTDEIFIGFKQIIIYFQNDLEKIGQKYQCNINVTKLFQAKLRIEGIEKNLRLAKNEIENLVKRYISTKIVHDEYKYTKEEFQFILKNPYIKKLMLQFKCLLRIEKVNFMQKSDKTDNDKNFYKEKLPLVIYCLDSKGKFIILEIFKKLNLNVIYLRTNKNKSNDDGNLDNNNNDIEFDLKKDYLKDVFKTTLDKLINNKIMISYSLDEIKYSHCRIIMLLIIADKVNEVNQIIHKKLMKIVYISTEKNIGMQEDHRLNKEINYITSSNYRLKLINQKIYSWANISGSIFKLSLVAKKQKLLKFLENIQNKAIVLFNSNSVYTIKIIFPNNGKEYDQLSVAEIFKELNVKPCFILNSAPCGIISFKSSWSNIIKGTEIIFNLRK